MPVILSLQLVVATLKLSTQPYWVVASGQAAKMCLNHLYRNVAKPVLNRFSIKSITSHLRDTGEGVWGAAGCIK